jgi:hypothetical protein
MLDNTSTLIFVALTSLLGAFAGPASEVPGQSLALLDDAGISVLVWDGDVARFYRQGEVQLEVEADTWAEVLWSVDAPSYGTVTAPHSYDRALTRAEIVALEDCRWAPSLVPVECGQDARCDCAVASNLWAATR